ncbi:MAG: hypothetical protein DYH08_14890 [Actinobacteria bacterium ATB1]|nr:hypothetical protein [Actinobacteria bacterium ATB1]
MGMTAARTEDRTNDSTGAPPAAAPPSQGEQPRMSEQEALMWNMEKDPWLSSNIGAVVLFDSELDWPRFRRIMARGAATIPELRRRPVADLGRLAPPVWETDPEFDLDAHVRHAALPPTDDAADLRPLLDFATGSRRALARISARKRDRASPYRLAVGEKRRRSSGEAGAKPLPLHLGVYGGPRAAPEPAAGPRARARRQPLRAARRNLGDDGWTRRRLAETIA